MAREGPGPGVVAEAARHGRGTAHSAGAPGPGPGAVAACVGCSTLVSCKRGGVRDRREDTRVCSLHSPPSLSRLPPGLLPTPRPGSHGGVSSGSPWWSAEWLGSVSAARGVPPRTGPQKPPRVPERRACGGRAPALRVALSPARATGLASSAHAADEVGPQHGEVS